MTNMRNTLELNILFFAFSTLRLCVKIKHYEYCRLGYGGWSNKKNLKKL